MSARSIIHNAESLTQALWGVSVRYSDTAAYYQEGLQAYARPRSVLETTRSVQKREVGLGIVCTAQQALDVALDMVNRSVSDLNTYELKVSKSLFRLNPGDIITFPFQGFTITGQIVEARIHGDYTQTLLVKQYLSEREAELAAQPITVPTLELASLNTDFLYLNGPLLTDGDDLAQAALVEYYTSLGVATNWEGAKIWRGTTATDFTQVGSMTSAFSPITGRIISKSGYLPNADISDRTNTLVVGIVSGNASNLTELTENQFYAGEYKALIGNEGRWALIHFKTPSLSGTELTIRNIIWGMRGTEAHLDAVSKNDYFIMVNDSGDYIPYLEASAPTAQLNGDYYFKSTHTSQRLGEVATEKKTVQGFAEKPYAPVQLNAVINGSDIDITWEWRTRIQAMQALMGANNTYFGESSLSFEVDIMDAEGSPSGVVRTLTSSTNSVTYTNAQITADFGSMPSQLHFEVYQMSGLVGRGYRAQKTVTL